MFCLAARPDIAYAVKEVARKASRPSVDDEVAVKRILRFLKGSKDEVLHFTWQDQNGNDDLQLLEVNVKDRRTSGFVVGWHGFALLFANRTQTRVALSSAETKLGAMTIGIIKACLLRSVLEEIGYKAHIRILSDATAATAKGRRCGPRQDVVEAGMITLCHLPSAEKPADLLSKPLTGDRHLKLRRELGLRTQYTDKAANQRGAL